MFKIKIEFENGDCEYIENIRPKDSKANFLLDGNETGHVCPVSRVEEALLIEILQGWDDCEMMHTFVTDGDIRLKDQPYTVQEIRLLEAFSYERPGSYGYETLLPMANALFEPNSERE